MAEDPKQLHGCYGPVGNYVGDKDAIEYLIAHVIQGLLRLQRLIEAPYNSSLARL